MTMIKTRYIALLIAAAALFVGSLDAPAAEVSASSLAARDANLEMTFQNLGLLSATEANCRTKLTPAATVLANYAYNTDFDTYSIGSVKFYELAQKHGRKQTCVVILGLFPSAFEK